MNTTWMPLDEAARILGSETITLRRSIERNARRKPSGAVESRFDGVCARKLGRLWRVRLDPEWLEPFERTSPGAR